jgi:hypothetical protein
LRDEGPPSPRWGRIRNLRRSSASGVQTRSGLVAGTWCPGPGGSPA